MPARVKPPGAGDLPRATTATGPASWTARAAPAAPAGVPAAGFTPWPWWPDSRRAAGDRARVPARARGGALETPGAPLGAVAVVAGTRETLSSVPGVPGELDPQGAGEARASLLLDPRRQG